MSNLSVKGKYILGAVITVGLLLRLFQIGSIPPMNGNFMLLRLLSAIMSTLSCLLLYFLTNKSNNVKISMLTVFYFSVFPWTVEQGRIYSQITVTLFFIILLIWLSIRIKNKFRKLSLLVIPLIFFLFYPDFWIFRDFRFVGIDKLVTNVFFLLSPQFLFFSNTTFWWGGIRDFGIMFLCVLPFLILGVMRFVSRDNMGTILLFIFILVISALSPFLPESREFFLSMPIFSLMIALGCYHLSKINSAGKLLTMVLILIMIYELSQYLHFMFVHYAPNVGSNIIKIYGPF